MRKKTRQNNRKKKTSIAFLWKFFVDKLLENMDASVMVADTRGKVVFANRKFFDLFQFPKKQVIGRDWIRNIIPRSRQAPVQKIFSGLKKKRTLTLFDTPVMVAGDGEKYVSWAGVPLRRGRASFYMFMGWEGKCPSRRAVRIHPPAAKKHKTSYVSIVEALFAASMISEPSTAEHAARVMLFSVLLAGKMKLSKARIEKLKVASLLHDLGKLMVDEKILFKKGRLSKREFDQIKKHPHWGSEVVRLVYILHDIIPIMVSHHENYDGSGYPRGIKGEKIPLEARILSVADIYEALTADRPYRKGFSKKEAIAIMKSEKGRKLDPEITDVFFDMLRKNKFRWEGF